MGLRLVVVLTAILVVLAGCFGGGGKGGSADGKGAAKELPQLQGYIVDPAVRPLAGVVVKVLETNVTATTDDSGHFGFKDLPTDQFLVIVANKAGFIPQPKQVSLVPDTPVMLNFTLQPEPVKDGFMIVEEFEGYLGCQLALLSPLGNNSFPCNPGAQPDRQRWDLSVGPDLAGLVMEVFWDDGVASTAIPTTLGIRLETLELGQLNVVLGETIGASPQRIQVPQSSTMKYYPQGGLLRLTVFAASDGDENEAGLGYSLAVNQVFNAYASEFYVDPAPAGYTIDV